MFCCRFSQSTIHLFEFECCHFLGYSPIRSILSAYSQSSRFAGINFSFSVKLSLPNSAAYNTQKTFKTMIQTFGLHLSQKAQKLGLIKRDTKNPERMTYNLIEDKIIWAEIIEFKNEK
jgi:hypothetical protein